MRFNTTNRPCEAVGVEEINGLVQNAKWFVVQIQMVRSEIAKWIVVRMPNAVNANVY